MKVKTIYDLATFKIEQKTAIFYTSAVRRSIFTRMCHLFIWKKMEKRTLFVGLVCMDIVAEIEGFPIEDTDQR